MFNSKLYKFIGVVGLQVLVIAVIIIYKLSIINSGTEVLLRLAPVDPRDPLRGDYMSISYDISTIENYSYYNQQNSFKNGDTVYVPLYKSGKFWVHSGSVLKSLPAQAEDSNYVYIRGTVVSGGDSNSSIAFDNWNTSGGQLRVEYGIEEYFIPEGSGRNFNLDFTGCIDRASNGLCMSNVEESPYASVSINSRGEAVLNKLYVNNKPWP